MSIKLDKNIPAFDELIQKGVFVIDKNRAEKQDIRALQIGILNLMPEKEKTETEIFRMIGNSPLQLEPVLIKTKSYESKNTKKSHLENFYITFDEAKKKGLDALIITGAPVENMKFEDVKYWKELEEIFDWTMKNITSTLCLCWAGQAILYHFYGLQKTKLDEKFFGVFQHKHKKIDKIISRGLDDYFFVPHSYHSYTSIKKIKKIDDLEILNETNCGKANLVISKNKKIVCCFGHPEYDRNRLSFEYFRDKQKRTDVSIPKNYFPNDNPNNPPKLIWRANAELFYRNWINFVYQTTNFDLKKDREEC